MRSTQMFLFWHKQLILFSHDVLKASDNKDDEEDGEYIEMADGSSVGGFFGLFLGLFFLYNVLVLI